MFDNIGNMPLHPLVIHAAVVGVPLAALLAFLFAFRPTRNWARWPLALAAVGATAATFVSRASGPALREREGISPGTPVGDLIAVHATLATQLVFIMIVFMVLGLINVFVVSRDRTGPLAVILPLLLVVVAVVAVIWVVRVGDIGSRAVWNPTDAPFMVTLGG